MKVVKGENASSGGMEVRLESVEKAMFGGFGEFDEKGEKNDK